ncbi:MAG: hypothetical protein JWM98_3110 [Thermoleophilia bacterium]|nr:hypothetical protein [Thermoleophilia bacterium]
MLIRDDGTTWTAIGQPAHAWLAGQLARSWTPRLPEDVILAVQQHDAAWAEWDRRPTLHEGRAAAFFETPVEPRLELWRHVAHAHAAQSPYAALLVSIHATNIHTRYGDDATPPVEFLAGQRADQDALLATLAPLGVTRESAERDGDVLFTLDALSLALCHGWPARELPPVDGTAMSYRPIGPWAATIDPWPFATDEVEAWLDARTFTERFDTEDALHRAFDAAPVTRLRWTLRRP